ncbi:hypothetical protein C8P70_105119 [Myroides indicus]|uniref:Uncharacterized protein n=1 Tax=Myroides indicus TaxID=1323422 RepID=A0A4R7F671_9FLAO|nr:hypothetical protein C8P70_105119 [Myroides indicus]
MDEKEVLYKVRAFLQSPTFVMHNKDNNITFIRFLKYKKTVPIFIKETVSFLMLNNTKVYYLEIPLEITIF